MPHIFLTVHGTVPTMWALGRQQDVRQHMRALPHGAVAYAVATVRASRALVKLGVSRQVVIPKKLHDRLGLKPGDYLEVEEQQGRVIMTPKTLIDGRVPGRSTPPSRRRRRSTKLSGRVERGRRAAGRCGSFTPPASRKIVPPRRRMYSAHSTSRSGYSPTTFSIRRCMPRNTTSPRACVKQG